MDFLVAEETVGYGPCLVVESTSPRYLNLVPLMHQIPLLCENLQVCAQLAEDLRERVSVTAHQSIG